jgi:hypothetical protein
VLRELLALLRSPALADVLPLFVESRALAALGEDAVHAALRWPEDADPATWALLVSARVPSAPITALARSTLSERLEGWRSGVRLWLHNWWGLQRKNARLGRVWYKRSLTVRLALGPFYDVGRWFVRRARNGQRPASDQQPPGPLA